MKRLKQLSAALLASAVLLSLSGCVIRIVPGGSGSSGTASSGAALSVSTAPAEPSAAFDPSGSASSNAEPPASSSAASSATRMTATALETDAPETAAPATAVPTAAPTAAPAAVPTAQVDPSLTAPAGTPSTDVSELEPVVENFSPIQTADYYGAQQLAEEPRLLEAYKRLASAADRLDTRPVSLAGFGLTETQLKQVVNYYMADYPQHFWVEASYRYAEAGSVITAIELSYTMSAQEAQQASRQVQAAAARILQGLEGLSEYEIEKRIHDALVSVVTYDTTQQKDYIHTLYGALVNGEAVCDGYARAFQYLLYQVGIPCLLVTGESLGENHAWNIVEIGGQYYQVDVTWDDPDNGEPGVMYAYFNLTDALMAEDHTAGSENPPLPACASTDANYFVRNGGVVYEFDAAEAGALVRQAAAGSGTTRLFVMTDPDAYFEALRQNWTAVLRAAGLNRGARFYSLGREVVILLT